MCEFCTQHGDGKVWFDSAANYSHDLMSDLARRRYISDFFQSTIEDGLVTIGRLEALFKKKKQLPQRVVRQMVSQAKKEHFGQVVTIEDVRLIIGKAATIVRMPCACRWASFKKEERCCFSVSYTPEAWYEELDMGYFGLAHHEGLESVSASQAIAAMEALEKHGAIHTIWTMMTPFVGAICNCRPEECLGMRTLAIDVETMFRGEQTASVASESCNGCGLCQESCHFDAVSSKVVDGEKIAVIEKDRCFGCGLCRTGCPQEAITMVVR